MWSEVHGDSQQRQGETLAAAQEAMGIDPVELERQILSSDESRLQAAIAPSAASPPPGLRRRSPSENRATQT